MGERSWLQRIYRLDGQIFSGANKSDNLYISGFNNAQVMTKALNNAKTVLAARTSSSRQLI
jgi:hypothetical protein